MEVYYVSEIISFGDFESPQQSKRVSDYFKNKDDADNYMKEHYPESDWNNKSWNTVSVVKTNLEIK